MLQLHDANSAAFTLRATFGIKPASRETQQAADPAWALGLTCTCSQRHRPAALCRGWLCLQISIYLCCPGRP